MAAVSSSALLVCETLAVHDKNSRDAIHLSIVASRRQSSLSEMHDLVADGAKVKGAISSFQTKCCSQRFQYKVPKPKFLS